MFWIVFVVIYVALSLYTSQVFKQLPNSHYWRVGFLSIALCILIYFFYQFQIISVGRTITKARSYAIGFLLCYFTFVIVIVSVLFLKIFIGLAMDCILKFLSNNLQNLFHQEEHLLAI